MNDIILNANYRLIWKESTANIFVAELRHFVENEFGGRVETPIGVLVGFVEDRAKFWRIKLIIRNDITYSQTKNRVFVLVKSSYKYKMLYYWDRLVDRIMPNFRIDKNLKEEIKKYLIDNNVCNEPMSFQISEETSKSIEFIGEIMLDDID